MLVACPCQYLPADQPDLPQLEDGRCVLCNHKAWGHSNPIPEELAAAWRLGGFRAVYDWADAHAPYTRQATDVWVRVRDYRDQQKARIERSQLLKSSYVGAK